MKCKTDSYVIELRLKTNDYDEEILNKTFNIAHHMQNVVIKHTIKSLNRLKRNKEYNDLLSRYKNLNKEEKKRLRDILKEEGLTEYDLHKYINIQKRMFDKYIDINTAQKIASRVYSSLSSYLFKNGKKLHFKKKREIISIEGKTNDTGIRYRDGYVYFKDLKLKTYYKQTKRNKDYINNNLNSKIKYCRIKRRWHKHKYRYYIELILEGRPYHFKKKIYSNNKVGIDIGPSTIAIVSDHKAELLELASNVNKIEDEVKILNRRLDRQRRSNNPDNYNEDETIKKGKKKWYLSKRQRLTLDKLRSLYQKRKNQIKYEHILLANHILSLGTEIYVEDMQWSALAKKTKETKKNKNGKYSSKKRYGKSIANHAPSTLLSILEIKLNYINKKLNKVDTFKTRATQFDHISGEYIKHDLKERTIKLSNGDIIQRDLHSAFNLKHLIIYQTKDKEEYDYDIEAMNKNYNQFLLNHDKCINNLLKQKKKGKKLLSSMI